MLTNKTGSFYSAYVLETGLSDFHLMALTVMRKGCKKFQSRIVSYRSFKYFSNENFRESLLHT